MSQAKTRARVVRWVAGVPLTLAALLGLMLLSDWMRTPASPSFAPVVRASAIDHWTPPWGPAAAEGPPPGAALPKRWIVIGWDGASWDLILPMLDAGKLPNLASMMRRGAYGPIASFQPTLSPVLWTTVATGMPPSTHGILGFERPKSRVARRIERLLHAGTVRRALFDNADRRVPAIWNLISARGGTVVVVGYHNTFPAERVNGLMVSNYLMQQYKAESLKADGGTAMRAMERMIYPTELAGRVLPLESLVRRRFVDEVGRFADLDEGQRQRIASMSPSLDPDAERLLYFLRDAYVFDTFDAEVASTWLPRLRPDVAFVHFQALDLCSHYDLYFHDPSEFASIHLDPDCRRRLDAEAPAFRKTLTAFAVYLDDWLGRLVDALPPDTAVMVLSDHGFDPVPNCREPGAHDNAPPGILVVAGPGVQPGSRLSGASLYDVFPTLAATLGLPLCEDLPGRPLFAAFEPGLLDQSTLTVVHSYGSSGRFEPPVASPGETDPEVEKRLKSLGYLK